jgi:hypothetical protein
MNRWKQFMGFIQGQVDLHLQVEPYHSAYGALSVKVHGQDDLSRKIPLAVFEKAVEEQCKVLEEGHAATLRSALAVLSDSYWHSVVPSQ